MPPLISIILPVRDDLRVIQAVHSLLQQEYPQERMEILIVDNGSAKDILKTLHGLPITILREERQSPGGDIARNTGMRHARGNIFAFLDADCRAEPGWIRAGIRALEEQQADLAGGRIIQDVTHEHSAAQWFDAVTFLQQQITITKRGVAFFANLFIQRNVWEVCGPIPEGVAGGDILFTAMARDAGFRIVYAEDAVVHHPARTLRPLLRKCYRIGMGKGSARSAGIVQTKGPGHLWQRPLLQHLLPWNLFRTLQESAIPSTLPFYLRICLTAYVCMASVLYGFLYGYFSKQKHRDLRTQ